MNREHMPIESALRALSLKDSKYLIRRVVIAPIRTIPRQYYIETAFSATKPEFSETDNLDWIEVYKIEELDTTQFSQYARDLAEYNRLKAKLNL